MMRECLKTGDTGAVCTSVAVATYQNRVNYDYGLAGYVSDPLCNRLCRPRLAFHGI